MGMWQGILQGMQMIEEDKRLEEEQAFRREQFEFTKQTAADNLRLSRQRILADLWPDLRESGVNADELAAVGSQLAGIFGEDSPVVTSIVSSGNTEDATRILEVVRENYAAAQEQGRGEEYLRTVNVAFENARVTPSRTGEVDTTLVEQLLGESLESIGIDLDLSRTVPGSVVFEPPSYQPAASLEDLTRAERRIAASAQDIANQERGRINAATARINSMLQSGNLDQNREEELRADLAALTDRKMMIDTAIDSASGDNPDYSALLGMYGNDARDNILSSSTNRIRVSDLRPTFQETISRAPIVVQDAAQAERYFEMGVITERDSISYNGQTYAVADLIED